uniref:SH3 domain-containing protein n=1 Tax=Aplanochytrium stocchinoi TaxID=215587 RepID=A0A7S3PH77_9STRA
MEEYQHDFSLLQDGRGFSSDGTAVDVFMGEKFVSSHRHFDEASQSSILYGKIEDDTGKNRAIWISEQRLRKFEKDTFSENINQNENEYVTLETLEKHIIQSVSRGPQQQDTVAGQSIATKLIAGDLVEAKFDFDDETLAQCLVTKAYDLIEVIEDHGEWILGMNEVGQEGLLPKSYVQQINADELPAANELEDKMYAHNIETKSDIECRPNEKQPNSISSLKGLCSQVLLNIENEAAEPDILNVKVLEDISRHCSKRFSRMLLLHLRSSRSKFCTHKRE